jgi:hypothetical protein
MSAVDAGSINCEKEEPDFIETHCHWVGCDKEFHVQDQLVKVKGCLHMLICFTYMHVYFKLIILSFPPHCGSFYFLLHITITITNCNSLTSNVGGSILPRLNEQALQTYAAYSSILHQIFCHKLMVASWSVSEEKYPQKNTGDLGT